MRIQIDTHCHWQLILWHCFHWVKNCTKHFDRFVEVKCRLHKRSCTNTISWAKEWDLKSAILRSMVRYGQHYWRSSVSEPFRDTTAKLRKWFHPSDLLRPVYPRDFEGNVEMDRAGRLCRWDFRPHGMVLFYYDCYYSDGERVCWHCPKLKNSGENESDKHDTGTVTWLVTGVSC
jgi:hypothetical protein